MKWTTDEVLLICLIVGAVLFVAGLALGTHSRDALVTKAMENGFDAGSESCMRSVVNSVIWYGLENRSGVIRFSNETHEAEVKVQRVTPYLRADGISIGGGQ